MDTKTPNQILYDFALNLGERMEAFEEISKCDEFTIFKHKNVDGLELAIMRAQSKPHYHTQNTFFCFVNDAILTLGGLDTNGIGHVSDMRVKGKQIYPINAYVIHAAAPIPGTQSVELLIFTPSGERVRENEYPDDTYMPEKVEWHT